MIRLLADESSSLAPARSDDCVQNANAIYVEATNILRRHILLREISTTEKKKNREPANVWGRDTGEDANLSIVFPV